MLSRAHPILLKLLDLVRGRFSLGFLIFSSLFLFAIVCLMFVYMFFFRAYHNLRSRYRSKRKAVYKLGVEKAILEEPLKDVLEAFRPRRWGDAEVAEEVMVEAMRHLQGPPFKALHDAAYWLGFVERNLKQLDSPHKHDRGRAMDILGAMRAEQAIVKIIDILDNEPLDMKLVALKALAAIGDPTVLPYFIKVSREMSPAMMVRLASLMLEFGPTSHTYIKKLINLYPQQFTPRAVADILKESAISLESKP